METSLVGYPKTVKKSPKQITSSTILYNDEPLPY